ncbi:MAG: DinB family protein [Gemmatimonadaceae bacterium]
MIASLLARPESTEFAPFYANYVASVPDGDIRFILRDTREELAAILGGIPEARGEYRYADGKWTVKTLIGHMIDAERIFSYRALRLARGDKTALPGFEENSYAMTAGSDARTVSDLTSELLDLRTSTIRLFDSFPDDAWDRSAMVSVGEVTVRALAYILVGHAHHHLNVLRERYGVGE